jgi:hypothetical protein
VSISLRLGVHTGCTRIWSNINPELASACRFGNGICGGLLFQGTSLNPRSSEIIKIIFGIFLDDTAKHEEFKPVKYSK